MPVLYGYNPITGTWGVLSEVMNGYPFATDDETTAGVIDSKAVTPSSLSPALALKANTTDVNAALALKADITSLNEEKLLLTQEIDSLKKSAVENSNAPYLTASDYGAVALAKNSVGVGQFGINGVTVENLANILSATNWIKLSGTNISFNNGTAILQSTGAYGYVGTVANTNIKNADKFLISFNAEVMSGININYVWGAIYGTIFSAEYTGAKRYTIIATGGNVAQNMQVGLSKYPSGNLTTDDRGKISNVSFIDLTAHGLASLTEAQLSDLLPVYFDGEKTFSGTGCLISKDSDSNEVGRQYFSTSPMYSNATLKDVLTYSDGKYYHTHNVDADGNAIATPYDTEVEVNGQFSALSNGTVTYEPWFPDIGIYTDKFTLSKAITAVKELYKYGSTTPITDAVIASNGLSFTSASLTSGDLAYGVFEFEEPLRPLITVKSRNDDATVADTTNGKIYTFRPVITNGAIASWTVTEV